LHFLVGLNSNVQIFDSAIERNAFGRFWDPGGQIRASIKTDLTLIAGANTDWPQLIAAGEKLGIRIEQEEDKARQQQQQMLEQNFGGGR
jgi:hypothetical protein